MWTIQLPTCSQFHAPGVVSKRDPNFPTPPSYRLASRVYTALGVSITGSYLAQRVISYIDFLRGLTPPPPLLVIVIPSLYAAFFPVVFVSECTTKSVGSPTTSLAAASILYLRMKTLPRPFFWKGSKHGRLVSRVLGGRGMTVAVTACGFLLPCYLSR